MVFLAVLFKKTESEHLPMQNFPGKAFPGNYPLENFYPPSPGAKHNELSLCPSHNPTPKCLQILNHLGKRFSEIPTTPATLNYHSTHPNEIHNVRH